VKLYVIAGEASGDLHGSNLIAAFRRMDKDANIRAWGGDLMEKSGAHIVKHYRDLAFMGFIEVVQNLKTILGNLKLCKKDIEAFNPDAIVLIDYPGFNLRIAKWAKKKGIKVIYYIAPQIWAWNTKRVHEIKGNTDMIISILPFESDFYSKHGAHVDYVGHPLLDAIQQQKVSTEFKDSIQSDKEIFALLPGSRNQEIKRILPKMLSVVKDFPQFKFVIAGSPTTPISYYQKFLGDNYNIKIVSNQTYPLLSMAKYALVSSGTATLETALHRVPQIVCYEGSPISYAIAKRVVKVKYISLVNLILDKPAITELIQDDLNEIKLRSSIQEMIANRKQVLSDYEELITTLGQEGASEKAAQLIFSSLL